MPQLLWRFVPQLGSAPDPSKGVERRSLHSPSPQARHTRQVQQKELCFGQNEKEQQRQPAAGLHTAPAHLVWYGAPGPRVELDAGPGALTAPLSAAGSRQQQHVQAAGSSASSVALPSLGRAVSSHGSDAPPEPPSHHVGTAGELPQELGRQSSARAEAPYFHGAASARQKLPSVGIGGIVDCQETGAILVATLAPRRFLSVCYPRYLSQSRTASSEAEPAQPSRPAALRQHLRTSRLLLQNHLPLLWSHPSCYLLQGLTSARLSACRHLSKPRCSKPSSRHSQPRKAHSRQ
mmetsp:Transcript_10579/g.25637  ORF Transcript_10579/g.25637 Transcript_10579/m.25637 type:complete len:292 (+) Transcript_10579:1309-2184(+)